MITQIDCKRPLISEVVEEVFCDFPYPNFADLYDRSYPVSEPDRVVSPNEMAHEARIVAEEFRVQKSIYQYDLLSLEVALSLFSAGSRAYFIPKILVVLLDGQATGKMADIAQIVIEFLSDDCSNKDARIFEDMIALYSAKQKEAIGLAILHLCHKWDDTTEKYDSVWFYKNTLRLLA